jgi:hypothetical protein
MQVFLTTALDGGERSESRLSRLPSGKKLDALIGKEIGWAADCLNAM